MYQDYPDSHIILAGNLNILSDNELVIRTGVTSIVNQPTTGNSLLDRIYVCMVQRRLGRQVGSEE